MRNLIPALLISLLTSCASSADWEYMKFQAWRAEQARAASVKLGMTQEQVRTAWGQPANVTSHISTNGTTEIWYYGDPRYSNFETQYYLYFHNGQLSDITSIEP